MAHSEAQATSLATSQTTLQAALQTYCQARRPEAQALRVERMQRIFGGASRATWRFTLVETVAGVEQAHALILRQDGAEELLSTERELEVAAQRAFEGHGSVPVPRIWWLERDAAHLGSRFIVMEAITGCEAAPQKLMGKPFAQHHARTAEQTWSILGQMARVDPAPLRTLDPVPTAATSWQRELDHWAAVVDRDALEPQPITQAAIRWLRAHPPAPAQRLAIVHGDYRIGNLLVSPEGDVRGVLDWEMAHLGDPLEDLAWSINRAWCFHLDDRVGGLVPKAQAVALWQRSSGLRASEPDLHWWELFSCVKAQAIWLGSARAVQRDGSHDLMLVAAAWMLGNSQERAMLELMGKLHA